jgi:hypothetical protein
MLDQTDDRRKRIVLNFSRVRVAGVESTAQNFSLGFIQSSSLFFVGPALLARRRHHNDDFFFGTPYKLSKLLHATSPLILQRILLEKSVFVHPFLSKHCSISLLEGRFFLIKASLVVQLRLALHNLGQPSIGSV